MAVKKSILIISIILFVFSISATCQKITIAAASDLKFALDSVILSFKAHNPGNEVEVIYGSSGKFYEQIINEAPFDIFFSADIDYPHKLKEKKLTASPLKTYGIGQIVIWSKKIDPNILKMNSLLDAGISKIAIANPEHAPYGKRAKESLVHYGLYEKILSKLVFGENISQTAQFVTTGAADIGIVALSLAISPTMKKEGGKYYIIPPASHSPLEQAVTILKHGAGNTTATRFYNFIGTPTAIKILTWYGFTQK